ncbi:MAG: hypothetical protein WDN75_03455 [Bacteroidota bacterium]
MVRIFFLWIFACWTSFQAYGQCGSINIVAPAVVCKSEQFKIMNNTTASSYEWDFCTGDLLQPPAATLKTRISSNDVFDFAMVRDQQNWYGFTVGLSTSNLTRIDFGQTLHQAILRNRISVILVIFFMLRIL